MKYFNDRRSHPSWKSRIMASSLPVLYFFHPSVWLPLGNVAWCGCYRMAAINLFMCAFLVSFTGTNPFSILHVHLVPETCISPRVYHSILPLNCSNVSNVSASTTSPIAHPLLPTPHHGLLFTIYRRRYHAKYSKTHLLVMGHRSSSSL